MCPSFQGKPFREKCQEHEHVIEWQTDHFNEGSACREACLELMRAHTSGCCEARVIGNNGAHCRFFPNGKIDHKGYHNSKAVVCTSGRFTSIIIN